MYTLHRQDIIFKFKYCNAEQSFIHLLQCIRLSPILKKAWSCEVWVLYVQWIITYMWLKMWYHCKYVCTCTSVYHTVLYYSMYRIAIDSSVMLNHEGFHGTGVTCVVFHTLWSREWVNPHYRTHTVNTKNLKIEAVSTSYTVKCVLYIWTLHVIVRVLEYIYPQCYVYQCFLQSLYLPF